MTTLRSRQIGGAAPQAAPTPEPLRNVTPGYVPAPVPPPAPTTNLPAVSTAPITIQEFENLGGAAKQSALQVVQKINSQAHAADLADLGKGMGNLMSVARDYDPSRWNKGILGALFRITAKQLDTKFRTVNDNVNALLAICERQIGLFRRRRDELQIMAGDNDRNFIDLGQAVEQGEARIAWAEANAPAADPSDPMSVQRRADWDTAVTWAKRAVDDLGRQRADCVTNAAQIRDDIQNCTLLVATFNEGISAVIPELQRMYARYIIQMEQKKGIELRNAMAAEYDRAKRANADASAANTVAINTTMAASLISIETLEYTSQKALDSAKQVEDIRAGMLARLKAEAPRVQAAMQRQSLPAPRLQGA